VLLQQDNWKLACQQAIDELPADIGSSVGFKDAGAEVIIKVACEPVFPQDRETFISEVKVKWWNTVREEIEHFKDSQEGDIIDYLFDEILKMQEQEGSADLPVIAVSGDAYTSTPLGFLPSKHTVEELIRNVQTNILEAMFSDGGESMLTKDAEGRFCRDDGRRIVTTSWPQGVLGEKPS
jgi:hypothetical protein